MCSSTFSHLIHLNRTGDKSNLEARKKKSVFAQRTITSGVDSSQALNGSQTSANLIPAKDDSKLYGVRYETFGLAMATKLGPTTLAVMELTALWTVAEKSQFFVACLGLNPRMAMHYTKMLIPARSERFGSSSRLICRRQLYRHAESSLYFDWETICGGRALAAHLEWLIIGRLDDDFWPASSFDLLVTTK